MFLYHFGLQKGGTISKAIYGNFSDPKSHEIIACKENSIELLKPEEGKVNLVT